MMPLTPAIAELGRVYEAILRIDSDCETALRGIADDQQKSARNLLHYLALRRHDLRGAQMILAAHGLSSLGRTESHVRSGLEAVLAAAHRLENADWAPANDGTALSKDEGESILTGHTDALLGAAPHGRAVRIMVTMPGDAAADYLLVRDLVAGGMDCMRINCAHDDPAAWERMIAHVHRANRELQRACRVSMDIAGPKLRTAAMTPGPQVIKIKPQRDVVGAVVRPASVALVSAAKKGAVVYAVDYVICLDDDPPAPVEAGHSVDFEDARGRARRLRVRAHHDGVVIADLDQTAYVLAGTAVRFGADVRHAVDIPPVPETLMLKPGDTLQFRSDAHDGRPAVTDDRGRVLVPASIGITLPQVFADMACGEAVWFDDGKIGAIVRGVAPDAITVEITHARPTGSRLSAGKGVNLPDTHLRVSALTKKDIQDLAFVATHADLIGYSFVRHADDIHQLRDRLAAIGAARLGIMLKIETRHAFAELPKLLLACMRGGPFGVMIARGDLAVECGFERLAEVQEEILWICEAAHVPVVWATQVLESLAKTGMPSRAEVSDAAMSERAECVMLNKGPFIREAVRTLDNILRRMQAHQAKKRAMLRPLHVAQDVLADLERAVPAATR